jgi:hypothetical protein
MLNFSKISEYGPRSQSPRDIQWALPAILLESKDWMSLLLPIYTLVGRLSSGLTGKQLVCNLCMYSKKLQTNCCVKIAC